MMNLRITNYICLRNIFYFSGEDKILDYYRASAVVPGYYLVCYNFHKPLKFFGEAVVPGYYLVCYNVTDWSTRTVYAVVPGYYLVCYNLNTAHR